MENKILVLLIIFVILMNSCDKIKNPLISENKEIYLSGDVVDRVIFPIHHISEAKIEINSSLYNDSTFTDINGCFEFKRVPYNSYEIIITHEDYDTLKENIGLGAKDSIFMNYELERNKDFKNGRITTGFLDTLSVSEIFPLIDSLGIKIEKLNGFVYDSSISPDSVNYVRNILSLKPYLVVTDYTVYAFEGIIRSVCSFINLDQSKFEDWCITQNEFRFISKSGRTKRGYLEVPDGEEIQWARELRKYNIFRYIGLDYFIVINPN